MKVDSSSDSSYIGSVAGGPAKPVASAAAVAKPAAAGTPQAGVTVTLSASATGAAGSEVFNTGKVEAMKQAIADGSYKVNPEAIADKMLANAAEMLGAARRG